MIEAAIVAATPDYRLDTIKRAQASSQYHQHRLPSRRKNEPPSQKGYGCFFGLGDGALAVMIESGGDAAAATADIVVVGW